MLLVWINNLMATVNRTIGGASDDGLITALRISIVTGTGPYDLTMNQDVNYNVTIGDFVLDESDDTYVVSAVTDLAHFEVTDELGVGHAPITGDPIVDRAYTTLTLAEASISTDAASGDTLNWKVMNDGLISDSMVYNDTTLGTGGTLNITVPSGERHGGVAGAGARIQLDVATADCIEIATSSAPAITIEFLEFLGLATSSNVHGVKLSTTASANKVTVRKCIFHAWTDDGASVAAGGIGLDSGCDSAVDIFNCLLYDIDDGTGTRAAGIYMHDGAAGTIRILNCSIDCRGAGLDAASSTSRRIQNCAVFGTPPFSGASGWQANSGENCTDASSAPGSSNQLNQSSSLNFVDPAADDYNPRTDGTLNDNGADLSAIFTADLEGTTRSTPWTIGPYHDTTAVIVKGGASGVGGLGAPGAGPTGGSSGLGIGI